MMSTDEAAVEPVPDTEEMEEDEEEDEEESLPPNETIYVNNLNEKIKGEALKTALRAIFQQFGNIIEIVAMDSVRRRGQAFVVFDTIDSAQQAKERMQSFPLYNKPLRIQFAKSKSDVVSRRDGLPIPSAAERKEVRQTKWAEEKKNPKKPKIEVAAATTGMPVGYGGAAPTATRHAVEAPPPPEMQVPNKTLFVQNLPDESSELTLDAVFRQCIGFQQVRMVPGRMGICFVDFEHEGQAGTALQYLQGFQLSAQHAIVISYAKK